MLLPSGTRHQPGRLGIELVGLGMEAMMVSTDPDELYQPTEKL